MKTFNQWLEANMVEVSPEELFNKMNRPGGNLDDFLSFLRGYDSRTSKRDMRQGAGRIPRLNPKTMIPIYIANDIAGKYRPASAQSTEPSWIAGPNEPAI